MNYEKFIDLIYNSSLQVLMKTDIHRDTQQTQSKNDVWIIGSIKDVEIKKKGIVFY